MPDAKGRSGEREADPGFLILASLVDGPKHGYAMIDDIESFAGVRLSSATLYGAIARLARRGLIDPLVSDDRRQLYRLTAAGAEIARARFALLVDMANRERFRGMVPTLSHPPERRATPRPGPPAAEVDVTSGRPSAQTAHGRHDLLLRDC